MENSRSAASVFEAFLTTAEQASNHEFLHVPAAPQRSYHPQGYQITYGAARERILALKDIYARAGFGHGHRVALLFENRPEFFLHYLALNGLGISIVPVNPDYRREEILYLLDHSEADLVVAIPSRLKELQSIAADSLKRPTVADAMNLHLPERKAMMPPRAGNPDLESECALLYTSGTTGRPKGCILSNFYYLNAGAWYRDLGGRIRLEWGRERIYNPLPIFHMNNQAVTATAVILTAGCLILPERFSPGRWWPEVTASRATIVHYLGVIPPLLLKQQKSPEELGHCVRLGIGAGVEPELHGLFEERFGFPPDRNLGHDRNGTSVW